MCVRDFGDAARVQEAREILRLGVLLATTEAAKALLEGTAYALAGSVAAVDTGCLRCDSGDNARCVDVTGAMGAMA